MNAVLQHFAEAIYNVCSTNNINLVVDWIPRSENTEADAVSRLADRVDLDDWQISDEFFKLLTNRWGAFSIDVFANYYNAKCDRFYSLFYSPRSLGVDAFRYDWNGEFVLMVPPISLIPRALAHAKLCRCKGVIIVPLWTSASFWPYLVGDYKEYIVDFLQVKGKNVLMQGKNTNSLFGSNAFQGDLLALNLAFT